MTVSVPIPAKKWSVDQLVNIYYSFCKAYQVKQHKDDLLYLRTTGINLLKVGSIVDYRPFIGAKFFALGDDVHTEFWGYTSDVSQHKQEKVFERLVVSYLNLENVVK